MADTPHYHGHRDRLRQRFLKDLGASLPDYELVEMLLFGAHPRGDVKPLAKSLLAAFDGDLGKLLGAPPEEIMRVKGAKEATVAALKLAQAAAARLVRTQVANRPVLSSWQQLIDYCHVAMANARKEQFRLLFLDRKNVLIADEVQAEGTIDQTPVYPREVMKRALELGASAIIMVHNHPSGDPSPSRGDIDMTREIANAGAMMGVVLHDHLIIGREGHASFKSLGLL